MSTVLKEQNGRVYDAVQMTSTGFRGKKGIKLVGRVPQGLRKWVVPYRMDR